MQRPPLQARLLAETKSLAICWELKTPLSACAYNLRQALMWQSLRTTHSMGWSLRSRRFVVGIQSSAECWAQQLHPWSAAVLQPYHGPKQSWEMVELNISALKDSIGRAKASQPPHHTHKMHGWRLDTPQKRWKALGEPLDKHCALQRGDSLQNTGTVFWSFQTLTQSFKI